ncbi:hypothetical protein, partial [Hydrotalea sp.]|uniref:hypothetical protein n=1 Tax=Hydrotalea sp. TaxID=2881279 RepID=UPI0026092785
LKVLRYFNMIYSYPVEIGYDYFNGYGSIVPSGEILVQQQLNQILLKLPKNSTIISKCKHTIMQYSNNIKTQKQFRSVQIIVDVDPY